MDWSTKQQIKRALQNAKGYEPDPQFASNLRQICLQTLKAKENRRRRVASLSKLTAVTSVALVLCMGTALLIPLQNQSVKTPITPTYTLSSTKKTEMPDPQIGHFPTAEVQGMPEANLQSKASKRIGNSTETAATTVQPTVIKGEKEARQFLTQVVGERYSGEYQVLQRIEKEGGQAEIQFTRKEETASDPGNVIAVHLDSEDTAIGIVTDTSSADVARIVELRGLKSPAWVEDMLASRLQLFYRVSTSTLSYAMPELAEIDAHSGRLFGSADYLSAQYDRPFMQEIHSQDQSFYGHHVEELTDLLAVDTGIEVENLSVHEKKGEKGSTFIWQDEQGIRLTLETNSEGNVIGFAYQESDQHQAKREKQTRLSDRNAREIAARFLSKHMPKSVSHVYYHQASRLENGSVIQMEWMPAMDQIPIRDRSFWITIDLSDGKIVAFRGNFADIPDEINTRQKPMDRAECIATFLKQYPLQLRGTPSIHPQQGDPSFHYQLIGLPRNEVEFNAHTGKPLE